MNNTEPKRIPVLTENEINDRLHLLLDELEESERGAVLSFLEKILEIFERGSWKLGKV